MLGSEPRREGLADSLLVRLSKLYDFHKWDAYKSDLLTNFRSHYGIMQLPSKIFYDNTLVVSLNINIPIIYLMP